MAEIQESGNKKKGGKNKQKKMTVRVDFRVVRLLNIWLFHAMPEHLKYQR